MKEVNCKACENAKTHARRHGRYDTHVKCRAHAALMSLCEWADAWHNPARTPIKTVNGPSVLGRTFGGWTIIQADGPFITKDTEWCIYPVRVAKIVDGEYEERKNAVFVLSLSGHYILEFDKEIIKNTALAVLSYYSSSLDTCVWGEAVEHPTALTEYEGRTKCRECTDFDDDEKLKKRIFEVLMMIDDAVIHCGWKPIIIDSDEKIDDGYFTFIQEAAEKRPDIITITFARKIADAKITNEFFPRVFVYKDEHERYYYSNDGTVTGPFAKFEDVLARVPAEAVKELRRKIENGRRRGKMNPEEFVEREFPWARVLFADGGEIWVDDPALDGKDAAGIPIVGAKYVGTVWGCEIFVADDSRLVSLGEETYCGTIAEYLDMCSHGDGQEREDVLEALEDAGIRAEN